MSKHNLIKDKLKPALDSVHVPQDVPLASALLSRLVIRDKSSEEHVQPSNMSLTFSIEQTERVTLAAGRNNIGTLLFHPIPNDESHHTVAHVDWLGITLRLPEGKGIDWLFQELKSVFDLAVTRVRHTGWNGYLHRADIGKLGLVAWGGKAQRGTAHIEINGTGCAHISDWRQVQSWGTQHFARITRIDLTHDDLEGIQCNIDRVLEWQSSGGFNCGGRNAKVKLAGDWHDCTEGRTVYIGTRGNKMLRCYEKGKQLDDPASRWFRVELELRNKNRLLPWDMLTRAGQYLSGAYPCLAFLSAEQCKLRTTQKATDISLESMTGNAARLSGKAINVLMHLHCEDANVVVDLLRRDGIPKRLEPYEEHLKAMHDRKPTS